MATKKESTGTKKIVNQSGIRQSKITLKEFMEGKTKNANKALTKKAASRSVRQDGNYFVYINTPQNPVINNGSSSSGSCTLYHEGWATVARTRRDELKGNKGVANTTNKQVVKPVFTNDGRFVFVDATDHCLFTEKGTFMNSNGFKVTCETKLIADGTTKEQKPKFGLSSYTGALLQFLSSKPENQDMKQDLVEIVGTGAGVRILLADTQTGVISESTKKGDVVLFDGEEVNYWEVVGIEIEPKPVSKKETKRKVVSEDVDLEEETFEDEEYNSDEEDYDEDDENADDVYDDEE